MFRSKPIFAAIAAALALLPVQSLAQCADQTRTVALDKGNNVTLKSYLCTSGTGADAAQFRVEYYRLSDGAVSLLLANNSSIKLRKTLGPVKIVSNEVSKTYSDLVKQYGVTADVPNNTYSTGDLTFTVAAEDQEASPSDAPPSESGEQDNKDKAGLKKLRTLIDLWGPPAGDDFPASTEVESLQKKTIPNNLNYYYSFTGSAKDYASSSNNPGECDKEDFT